MHGTNYGLSSHTKLALDFLMVIAGLAISAFGIVAFVLPNHVLIGGVTGFARVIVHYTGFKIAYVIWVASAALLVLSYIFVGKKMAMSIIVSTFAFPGFIELFQSMPQLENLTSNSLLAVFFGGALAGIGTGMVIRAGASTGGSDVIPIILNHKLGLPIAPLVYVSDSVIILLQCFFSSTDEILAGILLTFIASAAINKIIVMGSSDVQFMIMSPNYVEINKALQEASVGTSLIHATTGHYGNQMDIILCIVVPSKLQLVKDTVTNIDPQAFMTIININDVRGRGFSMPRY